MTILLTKAKTTTGAPSASNLTIGNGSTTFGAELAVNTADKKLYSKDSTSAVVEIAGALHAYPVGAVYISVVATSPATLFGGTWAVFGAGRALVSLDSTDTDFDTAEELRGTKTHTLTTDEIPSHAHTISGLQNPLGTGSSGSPDNGAASYPTVTTDATGGGSAHNNIQPSIVVYMWKRTA